MYHTHSYAHVLTCIRSILSEVIERITDLIKFCIMVKAFRMIHDRLIC